MDWTVEQREAFGKLIREARELRGLKQFEVAEQTQVAASTLSTIERTGAFDGIRWMDVVSLARFYHIPLDAVATMMGQPPDEPEPANARVRLLCGVLDALPPSDQAFLLDAVDALVRGIRK